MNLEMSWKNIRQKWLTSKEIRLMTQPKNITPILELIEKNWMQFLKETSVKRYKFELKAQML